ncbi:MAG: hypothetical protein DRI65_16875, partial [Chloroflexota bacterium]
MLTVNGAVANSPESKVLMNKLFVVLVKEPVVEGVTFTLIVQLLFAAIVPFENEIDDAPATAVNVGVPQLVAIAFGGVPTTKLAGRGSTKLYPLTVPGLGFVIVIVKAETPFILVGLGLKLFTMVTLVGSTILAKRAP